MCSSCAVGIAILVKSCAAVLKSCSTFFFPQLSCHHGVTCVESHLGLEDPDAQAALAEGGFEAWTQGFDDFAAMAPDGAVDLSPARRDIELFFAVVQSRGGEFYVKQSL